MRLPGSRKAGTQLRRPLTIMVLALLGSACALAPGLHLRDTDHPLAGRIWDTSTATFIDEAQLRRRAAGAELLLLGETHDNPEHHRLQRRMFPASGSGTTPPALLMEQFDIDQQAALDSAANNGTDPGTLMRGWDWSQYRELVREAQAAGMPLRAANLPRASLRPVVRDGFASVASAEIDRLGLNAAWDGAREGFLSRVIEASHCGKASPQLRDGLVRAQRLRDATLADAALTEIGRGGVFILGRGHARRDVGVPRYIDIRRPGTRILSIGLVEVSPGKTEPMQYEAERVGDAAPYDIMWFTPRVERPDPCLNFGK